MTINTFKALSKFSTILVTSAMLTLPTVTASNAGGDSSDDNDPIIVDGGHMLGVCFLDGGEVNTASNGDNSCWNPVTDKITTCSGPNGSPDACYTEGRPTGGRLNKPVLNTGTMVIAPDTNTTAGSGMKPLNGKVIMRNVIRN